MKISKIILFSACSLVGAVSLQNSAFAAEKITNLNTTSEIQLRADASDNSPVGVDFRIHKFNLNFDINQAINSGDFFEIETHALPDLGNRDITASATNKTVIGKWEKVESNYGNRRYNTSNIATVADAQNIRPEVNTVYKYRATFNDEAVKLNDISFSLGVSGGTSGGYTIADRNYTTEAWVKVNEAKIASKNIEVLGWGKAQVSSQPFVTSSRFVVDKNQASAYNGMNWQNFGINIIDGLKGSFIDQTTPNMIQRISRIFERNPLISKEI